MSDLTPKQEAFALAYLETGNASEASLRSGLLSCEPSGEKYYVYLLIDPRDRRVFYVGKGTGKRAHSHTSNAIKGRIDNAEKHRAIMSILDEGQEPEIFFFSRTHKEAAAFSVERKLIDLLSEAGLTNIVHGQATNEAKAIEVADSLLKRIASKDAWLSQLPDRVRCAVAELAGSPEAFYDEFVESVKRIKVKAEFAIGS